MSGPHPELDDAVFFGPRPELDCYLVTLFGQSCLYVLYRQDRTHVYFGKGVNLRVLAHAAESRQNHCVNEPNQKPTRPDH